MKKTILIFILFSVLVSCNNSEKNAFQVGLNTFVYQEKVYRIIDNEITELGSLKQDSLSRSAVLNPKIKEYGFKDLDYISIGCRSNIAAVYRGDLLYYRMDLEGLNNLRESYNYGGLTINFLDEFRFQIYTIDVSINELTRILDSNGETVRFEFNGKTQMSSEIYRAIDTYSISSSLK